MAVTHYPQGNSESSSAENTDLQQKIVELEAAKVKAGKEGRTDDIRKISHEIWALKNPQESQTLNLQNNTRIKFSDQREKMMYHPLENTYKGDKFRIFPNKKIEKVYANGNTQTVPQGLQQQIIEDWTGKGWMKKAETLWFNSSHDMRTKAVKTFNELHVANRKILSKEMGNNTTIYFGDMNYKNSHNREESAFFAGLEQSVWEKNGTRIFIGAEGGIIFDKEIGQYTFTKNRNGDISNIKFIGTKRSPTPYASGVIGIEKKIKNALFYIKANYTPSIEMDSGLNTPSLYGLNAGVAINL